MDARATYGLGGRLSMTAEQLRIFTSDEDALEISGSSLAIVRRLLEAAARPANPASLLRSAGLSPDDRDAQTALEQLVEARALVEYVPASERIQIVGEGEIADALRDEAGRRLWRADAHPLSLAILGYLASAEWHESAHRIRKDQPTLSVSLDAQGAWVGPAFSSSPCPACLRVRRLAVEPLDAAEGVILAPESLALLAPAALQWAHEYSTGSTHPDEVLRVRGTHVTRHRLLPAASCPGCTRPTSAPLREQAARVAESYSDRWRTESGQEPPETDREPFLDPELGPFTIADYHAPNLYLDLPLVLGGFRLMQPHEGGFRRLHTLYGTFGTGNTESRRRLVAFAESVERSALLTQAPDVWKMSADQVREHALSPEEVELFLPEQYADPEFPFQPYDGRLIDWVWTYELTSQKPLLAPFDLFAAGRPEEPSEFRIYNEPFATGAAAHVTMRQAVLRSLLELIERDAMMLTWYLKLPVDELSIDAARSLPLDLARMVGYLNDRGIELRFFDLTVDLPVPTVLVMATARERRGQWPAHGTIVSAAAAMSTFGAMSRGLSEIIGHYSALSCISPEEDSSIDPASGRPWAWWPAFERYLKEENQGSFSFLGARKRDVVQQEAALNDTSAQIEFLLGELRARALKACVRAIGREWVDRSGLVAVKVFVPGLIPLAPSRKEVCFGARRFAAVQKKWGLSGPFNPDPHPIS